MYIYCFFFFYEQWQRCHRNEILWRWTFGVYQSSPSLLCLRHLMFQWSSYSCIHTCVCVYIYITGPIITCKFVCKNCDDNTAKFLPAYQFFFSCFVHSVSRRFRHFFRCHLERSQWPNERNVSSINPREQGSFIRSLAAFQAASRVNQSVRKSHWNRVHITFYVRLKWDVNDLIILRLCTRICVWIRAHRLRNTFGGIFVLRKAYCTFR